MSARKIDSYSNHTSNTRYSEGAPKGVYSKQESEPVNNQTNEQPEQHSIQPIDRNIIQAISAFGDALPIVLKLWKMLVRLMDTLTSESVEDGRIDYTDLIPKNSREYLALKSYRDIERGRDQQFTSEVYRSLKKEKKRRGLF
jgi:hypothetical protein